LRRRAFRDRLRRSGGSTPAQDTIHRVRRRLWIAERPNAGQHFVENHAQRKDIAQCVDQLAAELLRAGVAGSQQSELGYLSVRIAQQFGGAKIEQLDGAVGSHQNVGGFQIAVNDQVPVRKLDGIAYLKKQANSRLDRQLALVAVLVQE